MSYRERLCSVRKGLRTPLVADFEQTRGIIMLVEILNGNTPDKNPVCQDSGRREQFLSADILEIYPPSEHPPPFIIHAEGWNICTMIFLTVEYPSPLLVALLTRGYLKDMG